MLVSPDSLLMNIIAAHTSSPETDLSTRESKDDAVLRALETLTLKLDPSQLQGGKKDSLMMIWSTSEAESSLIDQEEQTRTTLQTLAAAVLHAKKSARGRCNSAPTKITEKDRQEELSSVFPFEDMKATMGKSVGGKRRRDVFDEGAKVFGPPAVQYTPIPEEGELQIIGDPLRFGAYEFDLDKVMKMEGRYRYYADEDSDEEMEDEQDDEEWGSDDDDDDEVYFNELHVLPQ